MVPVRPAGCALATHCPTRTLLGIVGRDDAFAEYLVLPEENLHRVPKEIDTDAATFVESLAAALAIQQQLTIRLEYKVLLLGDGKLGQLIAQTLALTGCELLVVGRHPAEIGSAFGAGHYDWNRGGCLGGRV